MPYVPHVFHNVCYADLTSHVLIEKLSFRREEAALSVYNSPCSINYQLSFISATILMIGNAGF
jgi:hypothetical protein